MLHKCKVSGFDDSMIYEAARGGFVKMVRYLYEHHSRNGARRALGQAAEYGYLNIVKYLLEHGVEPYLNTIKSPAEKGYWRIVQLLYESQDIPEGTIACAFLDAAKNGHVDVVRYLLSDDSNRGELDIQEAFCLACCGSFVRLALWLMDHEAGNVDVAAGLEAARKAMETAKYDSLDIGRLISVLEDHVSRTVEERNPLKRLRGAE